MLLPNQSNAAGPLKYQVSHAGNFDDGAFGRQVALEHNDAAGFGYGVVVGVNNGRIFLPPARGRLGWGSIFDPSLILPLPGEERHANFL